MATVLGNSIFGQISGRVGNFIYSSKKGKQYVRSRPEHSSKPKTQRQLEQSAKFRTIISFLKPLTLFLRVGFYKKKSTMSQFNAAMSFTYKNALAGSYPDYFIDFSKVLVSCGPLPGAINPQAKLTPTGEIEFTWENISNKGSIMDDDRVMLVAYNIDKHEAVILIGGNERKACNHVITIPSTFSGDKVKCYLAFQNTHKLEVSDSQFVGSLMV